MNIPKLISYSITKDFLIITYSFDGKEINAIIPAYTASTYLVDLYIAKDRAKILGKLAVNYKDTWMEWREFIIEARIEIAEYMPDILDRHHQVESEKHFYLTLNN